LLVIPRRPIFPRIFDNLHNQRCLYRIDTVDLANPFENERFEFRQATGDELDIDVAATGGQGTCSSSASIDLQRLENRILFLQVDAELDVADNLKPKPDRVADGD
jgi:hypothetical protein